MLDWFKKKLLGSLRKEGVAVLDRMEDKIRKGDPVEGVLLEGIARLRELLT